MRTTIITIIAITAGVTACKKKGDVKSLCEDNFAKAEKDDGKWSPGKGDKAKFMEYCTKQTPDVIRCSSMEMAFDKSGDCEKHTGIRSDGFKVSMELARLRDGHPPAGGGKPAEPVAEAETPPEPQPACGADAFQRDADPPFCFNLPAGFEPDGEGEQKRGNQTALVFNGPKYAKVQVLWGNETAEIATRNLKQLIDLVATEDSTGFVSKGAWHGGYHFHAKTEGKSPDVHKWQYVTTGSHGSLTCIANAYEGDDTVAAVDEACRSLQFK
jgi:hypothetical protein